MKKALLFFNEQHFKLALLSLLCLSQVVLAQKPQPAQSFEINLEQDERIETEIIGNDRVNKATGQPLALYGLNIDVPQGTPESMAMFYIQQEARKLGLSVYDISNLHHHATRSTNAGSVVRYRQYSGSFPVNNAEIAVTISPQNKVVFVMSSIEPNIHLSGAQPSVQTERAFQLAKEYLNVVGETAHEASHVLVYKNTKITRLAHEVVILSGNPHGEWHVFVDAQTEEIFKVINAAQYYNDCDHADPPTKKASFMATVDGTGMVFNPDPLSSNTVAYGATGYVDGNDASFKSIGCCKI